MVSTAIGEDKGRFQVALLTLGATHARFGHTQEALSALNESVEPRPTYLSHFSLQTPLRSKPFW